MSLIYVGAGWSNSHLQYMYENDIEKCICVDALPNKPHYIIGQAGYEKSKNIENFINAITKSYQKFLQRFISKDSILDVVKIDDFLYIFKVDCMEVKYYINTRDTDFYLKFLIFNDDSVMMRESQFDVCFIEGYFPCKEIINICEQIVVCCNTPIDIYHPYNCDCDCNSDSERE